MARTIWKWRLGNHGDSFSLDLPVGYRIVHAGLDGGKFTLGVSDGKPMPALWAEVDPHERTEKEIFLIVSTGEEYNHYQWEFVFTMNVAGFFFHLLRAKSCEP